MKILVFGNLLVKEDNLALKIMPKLREDFPKIEFIHLDPTEDLQKFGRNLMILDVVENIKEVMILDNLDLLETFKVMSMHDFDLTYNLKLLKKANMIDSVRIIGIPNWMTEEDALEEVKRVLGKFF